MENSSSAWREAPVWGRFSEEQEQALLDVRCWQVAVVRVTSIQHRLAKTCAHGALFLRRKILNSDHLQASPISRVCPSQ